MSTDYKAVYARDARETPRDCRHEPPYPGLHTVLFTDHGGSSTVMHKPSQRCPVEEPHLMATCGEFDWA